jgi:hypothetical protein
LIITGNEPALAVRALPPYSIYIEIYQGAYSLPAGNAGQGTLSFRPASFMEDMPLEKAESVLYMAIAVYKFMAF